MYPAGLDGIIIALGLVGVIWLVVVSYFVWKQYRFLRQLFPDQRGDFKQRLEEVLTTVGDLEEFKKKSLNFVQKVTFKRYNPYKDTGGDQSFSLALVDGYGNGVVVTSLHSRSGTRVFAKPVEHGKAVKFAFSEEETEVVLKAMSKNESD